MKTVKDILDSKGYEIWAVKPDDTVFAAVKLMADKEVGSLLVMDGEKLVRHRDGTRLRAPDHPGREVVERFGSGGADDEKGSLCGAGKNGG